MLIEDFPGIHMNRLRQFLPLANGTIQHHVQTLLEDRNIRDVKAGGLCCYYKEDTPPSPLESYRELHQKIMRLIFYRQSMKQTDLAKFVGAHPSTV